MLLDAGLDQRHLEMVFDRTEAYGETRSALYVMKPLVVMGLNEPLDLATFPTTEEASAQQQFIRYHRAEKRLEYMKEYVDSGARDRLAGLKMSTDDEDLLDACFCTRDFYTANHRDPTHHVGYKFDPVLLDVVAADSNLDAVLKLPLELVAGLRRLRREDRNKAYSFDELSALLQSIGMNDDFIHMAYDEVEAYRARVRIRPEIIQAMRDDDEDKLKELVPDYGDRKHLLAGEVRDILLDQFSEGVFDLKEIVTATGMDVYSNMVFDRWCETVHSVPENIYKLKHDVQRHILFTPALIDHLRQELPNAFFERTLTDEDRHALLTELDLHDRDSGRLFTQEFDDKTGTTYYSWHPDVVAAVKNPEELDEQDVDEHIVRAIWKKIIREEEGTGKEEREQVQRQPEKLAKHAPNTPMRKLISACTLGVFDRWKAHRRARRSRQMSTAIDRLQDGLDARLLWKMADRTETPGDTSL